jgi:hypothetical protein
MLPGAELNRRLKDNLSSLFDKVLPKMRCLINGTATARAATTT